MPSDKPSAVATRSAVRPSTALLPAACRTSGATGRPNRDDSPKSSLRGARHPESPLLQQRTIQIESGALRGDFSVRWVGPELGRQIARGEAGQEQRGR